MKENDKDKAVINTTPFLSLSDQGKQRRGGEEERESVCMACYF